MRQEVRDQFGILSRLSCRQETYGLLEQLDTWMAKGQGNARTYLMRANLLRRCGDLQSARDAFIEYLCRSEKGSSAEMVDPFAVVPPGLNSPGGFAIAPLIIIDDFLPHDDMVALHRHACALEPHFVDARTFSDQPVYDPTKRRTLVSPQFTYKKQFFLDFIHANQARMQRALGLHEFSVDRVEIKLTNHIHGGFHKVHADNYGPADAAGRAITWLYYFSQVPVGFAGGALMVLDSALAERDASPDWFTRVEAKPNRLVAFPSWFFHAVEPTLVPGNSFEAGRFAVSSHIRQLPTSQLG